MKAVAQQALQIQSNVKSFFDSISGSLSNLHTPALSNNQSEDFSENVKTNDIFQRHSHKKDSQKKYQMVEDDFLLSDQDGRNVLHRAALEQNIQLINDVLNEYKSIFQQSHLTLSEINLKIGTYINTQDKFKMSSLLLCCFNNQQVEEESNEFQIDNRFQCVSSLVLQGADVNIQNPRTLWSPINWCANYGDFESVQFLLKSNAISFLPDHIGNYPIDLAGRNDHKEVARIIFENLATILMEYDLFKDNKFLTRDNDKWIFYQELAIHYDRYLCNPILKAKLLYWCCYFNFDNSSLRKIYSLQRVYFNAPLYSLESMTALHAAAQAKNTQIDSPQRSKTSQVSETKSIEGITYMLDKISQSGDLEHLIQEFGHIIQEKIRVHSNNVFSFTRTERFLYKNVYKSEVIAFAKWEKQELKSMVKNLQESQKAEANGKKLDSVEFKRLFLRLNQSDLYGNTALHLASLKGNKYIVLLLLKYGADMEQQNKEFFKARQLTQYQNVLDIYKNKSESIDQGKTLSLIEKILVNSIKKFLFAEYETKKRAKSIFGNLSPRGKRNRYEQVSQGVNSDVVEDQEIYQKAMKDLYHFTDNLFVPDFVILCNLTAIISDSSTNKNLFDLQSRDSAELQRLNFVISMLQNAKFKIHMMKSYNIPGNYYIMLSHEEHNLRYQAELMQLQVKLIDSYDLEPFQIELQDLYEPFRSRQRQEVIENHIKRVMNLDQMIKSKTIHSYYRMHTYGGIEKIKSQWISQPKWYWPQPFCQMQDYIYEGQNQNFTSLTTMRLYMGEKISFFFAWKSFITCAMLFIAVPGLILQLYILYTEDFQTDILPYWVLYVCIWSTVQVEFWKRKTSEINTRWGCIDLMEDEEAAKKVLRDAFSGDEKISETTGLLTKHENPNLTNIILLISSPILMIFIALSITSFLGIQYLNIYFAGNNTPIRVGLGIAQGLSITILNITYTFVANWFVNLENHKYTGAHETSLIYKNVVFKFINSYLSIFYFMFNSDKTLKDIFYLMLPVLVVKQVNYMILEVFIPQYRYKLREQQYLNQVLKTVQAQNQNNIDDQKNIGTWMDAIGRFWRARLHRIHHSSARAVIEVKSEEEISRNLQNKDERICLDSQLDVDAVELNSLKLEREGTINYFMEGIIDYGYITLFAAAFPIGPSISMLVSIPEIRMKIFTYLNVYKRPNCIRCAGIGEWLNVIEILSIFSVFSNFALLYFKHKSSTLALYKSDGLINQNRDWQVWFFVFTVMILLVFKQFIAEVIPDKPEWVLQQIEKLKKKQDQENALKSAEYLKSILKDINDVKKSYQVTRYKIEKQKEIEQQKLTEMDNQIDKLQTEVVTMQRQSENIKGKNTSLLSVMSAIGKNKNSANEYDMIVMGVLKMKFFLIEWELLIKRLCQLEKTSTNFICVCQECGQRQATLECIQCDENFCLGCYKSDHILMNLKHEVRLINDINSYNAEDMDGIVIVKKRNQLEKQKYKFTKEEKQKINNETRVNSWKKFEYFSLPTYQSSEDYQYLEGIYQLFYKMYIIQTGLEFRNYEINLSQIFNNNDVVEQTNLRTIINDKHFNIEDKLFLNRLAFLAFKKMRHLTHFSKFYQLCKTLQEGMLEQKLILLADMVDINDDNIIIQVELQRIIIPSIVQDMEIKNKIDNLVLLLLPLQKVGKKEFIRSLLDLCSDAFQRSFLEALLQKRD